MSSVITTTYSAVVHVTLTKGDIHAWSFAGSADISGTYTSDFKSHADSPLGPCDEHFTDDASGSGTVDLWSGGIEASDGHYQFTLNIAGIDNGSSLTVRDDTGCFGGSTTETVVWGIAPDTMGGDGDYTDPNHITGSWTHPLEGGSDVLTWDLTLTP
jgi:hypothetical protein